MGRPMTIGLHLRLLLLHWVCLSLLLQRGLASLQKDQVFEGSAGARTLKQAEEHIHEVHCSRERSRAAWKIIEEYLMPFVEQEQYQIPHKCKLHADNDLYRDQEQHKIHVDVNEWKCGYCNKIFRAEKFLDQHFDNRHYHLLNVSHSKCLADLCGALHCDLVMDYKPPKTKCNPAAASRNRHLCESLADSCFPINGGSSASRLHELFLRQFCDSHTLHRREKTLFQRGAKAYQCILPCHLHIDFDVAACILCYCLSVPKGNEKWCPRSETHLKT